MLKDLNDLRIYAHGLATKFPSIASRVEIQGPGLSAADLSKLSAFGLPPIYARCISEFNLFGVAVGYFTMWPGSVKAGDMLEALIRSNKSDDRGVQGARRANLLVVAQEEANLVCVRCLGSDTPDEVVFLDVMRSSATEQQSIAPDFEKFLLLAGNLNQIGREHSEGVKEAVAKMVDCCRYFRCTVGQITFWSARAEIVAR